MALGDWPRKPPPAPRLMAVIRSIAQDHSERIFWGEHAFERLHQRNSRSDADLTDRDALRILRIGDIKPESIRASEDPGEWVATVIGPFNSQKGSRDIGVVTIVLSTTELFVKTVEWEDPK